MSSFTLPIIDFDLYMRDKTTLEAINECKKVKLNTEIFSYPQHRVMLISKNNLDCECFT